MSSLADSPATPQTLADSSATPPTSLKSKRNARVKRTIRRQRRDTSFAGVLVESLADVAQAFLYPQEERSKNAVNTSAETVDETHSWYDDDEEEERSLDTHTPPPNLVGAPAFTASSSTVKRPIPVSSPRSSFDPVFPSSFGEGHNQPSPIARMRAPPPPAQEQAPANGEQSRYSENFVADKHRKWRRQIKLQKKRLQQHEDDDTSLLTTCGPSEGKSRRGQEPVDILARLIRAPCGADVEDVMVACEEGAMSSDDEGDRDNSLIDHSDDDDDSTHYGSSVTGGDENEHADDRKSDFTGASEYTDESSRHQSPKTVSSSGSTRSSTLKGVLKASSFGSSSVRTRSPTPTPEEEEQSKSKDKNFIKAFIEELTQDGMLLIWHGPQGDSTAFRRPCGVVAHLNLGEPTDGIYGGPQIVWHKQDGSDGGVIDLFDIQSMDTASLDMLESYQFAIPDNTFFVVLNNGKHVVFEASSEVEAKRFVHGLCWVVARLSFNLVVGNPLVSCELLSVEGNRSSDSPQTPMEEALMSKAMNDVTNHLVDKTLMQTTCQEEE